MFAYFYIIPIKAWKLLKRNNYQYSIGGEKKKYTGKFN